MIAAGCIDYYYQQRIRRRRLGIELHVVGSILIFLSYDIALHPIVTDQEVLVPSVACTSVTIDRSGRESDTVL